MHEVCPVRASEEPWEAPREQSQPVLDRVVISKQAHNDEAPVLFVCSPSCPATQKPIQLSLAHWPLATRTGRARLWCTLCERSLRGLGHWDSTRLRGAKMLEERSTRRRCTIINAFTRLEDAPRRRAARQPGRPAGSPRGASFRFTLESDPRAGSPMVLTLYMT